MWTGARGWGAGALPEEVTTQSHHRWWGHSSPCRRPRRGRGQPAGLSSGCPATPPGEEEVRSAGVASSGGSGSHRGFRTGQGAGPDRCVGGRSVRGLSRGRGGVQRQPAAVAGALSFQRPSPGGWQQVLRTPELVPSLGWALGGGLRSRLPQSGGLPAVSRQRVAGGCLRPLGLLTEIP